MGRVDKAVLSGRFALAVSGSLLRDPSVVHALAKRADWSPMTLSGVPTAPVVGVGAGPLARVVAEPGGVVVVVEPDSADLAGLTAINKLVERSPNKPTIVVVSRSLDLLRLKLAFPTLAVEHEKGRGKDFLEALPLPNSEHTAVIEAVPVKAAKDSGSPRFCFVGRDEEVASMAALLAEPGPVVVLGPYGVGRTQVIDHAVAAAGLTRTPEFTLGPAMAADALYARLAALCVEGGDSGLSDALKQPRTPHGAVVAALTSLRAANLGNHVLVVQELQFALGREGDFFRRSRLELLVEALLTEVVPLRIVFTSTVAPRFHREGQDHALRRVEIAGLKGRFLHDLFEANHAPEFPRDQFGPLSERIHGHPIATRMFAVAVRDRPEHAALLEDTKFLASKALADLEPLRKHVSKRIEAMNNEARGLLSGLAHSRIPLTAELFSALSVKRQPRLDLLAAGLLDTTGLEGDRRFRVHPLVRTQMTFRECNDFDTYNMLADAVAGLARAATGVAQVALGQEANRCGLSAGRNARVRVPLEWPDQDSLLDQLDGMLRSREARLDVADDMVLAVLAADPSNADAWIHRVEIALRGKLKNEELEALLGAALDAAPCPELVQRGTGAWTSRKDSRRAIAWLEAGIERMPNEARLHTRLGALLQREGRRNEAVALLERAMELQPMLPDAYGLLGMARRDEGHLVEAEQLLREAVRLAPGDPTQTVRLADLLAARARVDDEAARALRAEAKELLEPLLQGDRPPEAALLLATVLREDGAPMERRAWLLDQAGKASDRALDRAYRVAVERALHQLAEGNLDASETVIVELSRREPSQHRAFGALGHLFEAREMPVPAHAEYQRARDRAPQGTLERLAYERHMQRLASVIEGQIAALYAGPVADEDEGVLPLEVVSPKIKRRGKGKIAAEAPPEPT